MADPHAAPRDDAPRHKTKRVDHVTCARRGCFKQYIGPNAAAECKAHQDGGECKGTI